MLTPIKRWLLPIAIILIGVICYALLIFFQTEKPATDIKPRIWPVHVLPVKFETLAGQITIYGTVENPAVFSIAAPAQSYVQSLPVREGKLVQPGELLVTLDQRDFQLQVDRSQAVVVQAQSQLSSQVLQHKLDKSSYQREQQVLGMKQQALQRAKTIFERKLGSQYAVDLADESYQQQQLVLAARNLALQQHPQTIKQLTAALKQAQADLALARLDLERSTVNTPYAAIVGRLQVAEGDRVASNQVLFQLYPLQRMQVRARIPAPYLAELQAAIVAQPSTQLTASSLEYPQQFNLERMAGEADARGLDALFVPQTPAPMLRVGMALTMNLTLPAKQRVMAVPYQALYGNDRAYKVIGQQLQGITIKRIGDRVGADGRLWALIQSTELQDGDQLVVTHLPDASQGIQVKPQRYIPQSLTPAAE